MYILMFYLMLMIINFLILGGFMLMMQKVIYMEFEFIKFLSINMEYLILVDWVSLLFIGVVLMISMMVIIYSLEYMKDDLFINRFMFLIYLFVFFMILMIISPNLLSILFGWDGLGLVSYCLVIYYQSKKSFNSGMVTVMINRLGDILILMIISLMIMYGSWNFMFLDKLSVTFFVILMVAAFTKSAQIPFSTWLPLAMAAPTPVSSLVHSSTLVTAGVYLLIRLNYCLIDKKIINLMMLIAVSTLFLSGVSANFEMDLKKIIALSTLSQLGVMIFCLSMLYSDLALFHLLVHAMFKSMLFMCAGVIIHYMGGTQDIRYISMVTYNFPLISGLFNCSSLSLCGMPFLSGFFSKDLILEMFLMSGFNKLIFFILFTSMGLTVSYTIRLMYYSFIKLPKLNLYYCYLSINSFMGVSMYLLFFMSIAIGLILSWLLFSMKNLIYLSFMFKLMIYMFMMIGGVMGLMISKLGMGNKFLIFSNLSIKYFSNLWLMFMFHYVSYLFFFKISSLIFYYIEMGWIEYLTIFNFMELFKKIYKLDFLNKNYFFLLMYFMVLIFLVSF